MTKETWDELEALFSAHPVMRAEPVLEEEFNKAAAGFEFPVPDDFRDFVLRYGGAIVGSYPIVGLRRAHAMGVEASSFVEVTRRYRSQAWLGVDKWVVVSIDQGGNPIGISRDGQIWCSDHDTGEIVHVAPSFEAYLRSSCLGLSE